MSRKVGFHRRGDGDLTRYHRGEYFGFASCLGLHHGCGNLLSIQISKKLRFCVHNNVAFMRRFMLEYEWVGSDLRRKGRARGRARGERGTCGKCKTFKNGNSLISRSLKSLILFKYNI